MPRPPRADEAGGLYHALNRGNARTDIFRNDADFEAFERISKGLERYVVQLFAYESVYALDHRNPRDAASRSLS